MLVLVVGDNLEVNTILGFARLFSPNYFCRFCISDKKKSTKVLAIENTNLLCNKQNYNETTGIYEHFIFNNVYFFHVVNNHTVDIMHDIFEVICLYSMTIYDYNMTIIIIYYNTTMVGWSKYVF